MTNKEILFKILSLLKPYKLRLITASIALLAVVLSMLLLGYEIKHYIDNSLKPSDHSFQNIIILIVIFGVGSFGRSYLINTTAEFASNDIKLKAYRAILSMNSNELDKFSYSDLSTRMNSDTDFISRVIIDSTSFFMRNAMTLVGGTIFMFLSSIRLSIITFSIIGLIVIVSTSLSKKVKQLAKNAESAKVYASSIIYDTIINSKVITAFSRQNNLISHFNILNNIAKSKAIERLKYRSIFFASVISSMMFTIAIIIWIGSVDVSNGSITSGTLASFLFYSFMASVSFGGIIEMFGDLQKNLNNCEKVFEIISLENKSDALDKIHIPTSGYIELKNITYRYENNLKKKIIENLNLKIEISKFTVIKGHSGIGKTTILNLIIGLYNFESGEIKIGDKSFSNISPESWDKKLTYVPQENLLFTGTILENISFFELNPDIKKVEEIITKLQLSDLINSLPDKLSQNIGSLATKVSGGQRQRIAIARAIYSNPEILILDEATSQLDEETETKILGYLKDIFKNKTVICVAHRPGAIKEADNLISI